MRDSLVALKAAARVLVHCKYHFSLLLLLIPLVFLPQQLRFSALTEGKLGLGNRLIGAFQVGPWQVELAEWDVGPPSSRGLGKYQKLFVMKLCGKCLSEVKATYIRMGESPTPQVAGALFEGIPYRQLANLIVPDDAKPDAAVYLTLEGWNGTFHQISIPMTIASPATSEWLRRHQASGSLAKSSLFPCG